MTSFFSDLSVGANLAFFAGAAVIVWFAGSRLAGYADDVARRTGLNQAFVGLILLGIATSLPEIATSITGAAIGNAQLVTGNLFGGVALQIVILAVVDFAVVRGALTYFTPQPILLLQGVMLLLLLSVALAGTAAGEPVSVLNVGLTPVLLVLGYIFTVRMSQKEEFAPRWRVSNEPKRVESKGQEQKSEDEFSNALLYTFVAICGAVILVAGWVLAKTGDALAEQTGLGSSFVGVALVAWSTSLPELSTTFGAVKRGNHQMAVANILGTNCLEVALFFIADLFYRKGPILAETDQSGLFAGVLGMILTSIFLVGLLERRDRTIFRMGWDSLGVLIFYAGGLGVLYYLR